MLPCPLKFTPMACAMDPGSEMKCPGRVYMLVRELTRPPCMRVYVGTDNGTWCKRFASAAGGIKIRHPDCVISFWRFAETTHVVVSNPALYAEWYPGTATLKSVDYNVAMTFILNNNNSNSVFQKYVKRFRSHSGLKIDFSVFKVTGLGLYTVSLVYITTACWYGTSCGCWRKTDYSNELRRYVLLGCGRSRQLDRPIRTFPSTFV